MRPVNCRKSCFAKLIISLCIFLVSFAVSAVPGLDFPTPVAPYLEGVFPSNSSGTSSGAWTQVDYYPDLTFVEPIRIVEHPTENKLIIVGKDGKGWSVTHQVGATDKTLFFDIGPIMLGKSGNGEGGISDLVFHPEFGNLGSLNSNYVYISYRWHPTRGGEFDGATVDAYNRISRFSVVNGQVDLTTELALINQYDRQQWHIGGDMFFGDDGFLYISAGDEGNCCSRLDSTQRIDGGLWSGILRIDVDQNGSISHPIRRQPIHPGEDPQTNGSEWPPSFTQGYYIPNDNPFLDVNGSVLEEFYSIGLRHPWTIALDNATGKIWAADVGQGQREEIDIVNKGDNHQWAYMEGTVSGLINRPSVIIGNETPPIWDYPHTVGQAVIGAGVYRGNKFPELFGKYIFSDFISGILWTATASSSGYDIDEIGSVTSGFPNGINSYLLDSKGDILLAKTSGGLDPNGKIQMLARSGSVPPAPEPPLWLSQTGAFTDLATLSVHPGCVPYDLNVPFWSDAALKFRWMCVPNDGLHDSAAEQISFSQNGDWVFPEGAVLIKHFEIQTDSSDPTLTRRLETRFIVHAEDGYYGVTYRWDEFGIDAQLLTTSEELDLTIQTPSGPVQQTWHFPSRGECLTCHTNVAGGVLGPKTRQLNRTIFYPTTGRVSNQIETLNSLGMLSPGIAANDLDNFLNTVLTSTPTQDTNANISARARSYLDSNCSYCHRPNGVRANFDARLTTPLAQQGLINGELAESLGINGEAVVVPGDTSKSVLYLRLNSAGQSISMPPLAKAVVDAQGASVIEEWIQTLGHFELGNDTTTGGSFIDGHHPSLYINEQDIFIQDNEPGELTINEFKFFVQRLGNPITPVVVRVNGDNDFTVIAIGTTRTQNDYVVGSNTVPFNDSGNVTLTLGAGEKIAIGFMDSFPDGSGWGAGTVIPAENNGGANQDEIWGLLPNPLISQSTGFLNDRDTPTVSSGEKITVTNQGKSLKEFVNLRRSYKFAITFFLFDSAGSGGSGGSAPAVVNGSFEDPIVTNWQIFTGPNDISGWTITSGSIEIARAPWPAFDGAQSIDLSGNSAGSLEQTISGLQSGATYELAFEYALHKGAKSSRSAEALIDGLVMDTVVADTSMKPPNYQSKSIEFIASSSGSVTIGFNSLSSGGKGVVIDNVRLIFKSGSGGLPTVATPTITPNGGTHTDMVDVTLNSTTSGAILYYTLDGSTPNALSMQYTGPFTLTNSATVNVIGIATNHNDSSVASANFTITNSLPSVATPTITPNGGTHTDTVEVTLDSTTSGAILYYTLDGSTPDALSMQYMGPFALTNSATVTVIGIANNHNDSSVASANFTITPSGGGGGAFIQDTSGEVSMEAESAHDNIAQSGHTWTEDTSFPGYTGTSAMRALPNNKLKITESIETTSPQLNYQVNFDRGGPQTLWIRGYGSGGGSDSVHAGLNGVATITVISVPRTGWGWVSRTIDVPSAGVHTINIWMREDGVRIDKIVVNQGATVSGPGPAESPQNGLPTVATPTITPQGGTFADSVTITLASNTQNALIYYTLDGSDPTVNDDLYSNPFSLTSSATLKSRGFLASHNDSAIASADFTITNSLPTVATPTITPNGGTHTDMVEVTLDSTTSGAILYYTLDGSTPNALSMQYTGPFTLTNSATVNVIGIATNHNDSSVASADFTITTSGGNPGDPNILNGGFENELTDWNHSNVALNTANAFSGQNSLDLKNGYIEQNISGLVPGNGYYLELAYRSQSGVGTLADAQLLVDSFIIGEIHNKQVREYLNCNGFEFIANSQAIVLRIESLETGNEGLLIDDLRLSSGPLPVIPQASWNDLVVINDSRGGRQLVNGGFESPISDHRQDPDNSGSNTNPHVCGFSLPGWRVTQENVDVISQWDPDPEGNWVLDTGGHGPGGIAQTITDLNANATYTLSFWYARHSSWGSEDMTGEVLVNGSLVETLVRNNSQKRNTGGGYELKEIDIQASATGELAIEIRSTTKDKGGNIIYDDIRLK